MRILCQTLWRRHRVFRTEMSTGGSKQQMLKASNEKMKDQDQPGHGITRRELLKYGAALGGAEWAASLLAGCGVVGTKNPPTAACSNVNAIDHVVIVIM